jgi:predicted GIY-YIG superfamily endonuclease
VEAELTVAIHVAVLIIGTRLIQGLDMTGYVYRLIDPRNSECFYIGMTSDPRRRIEQHTDGRSFCTSRRVSEITSAGELPVMEIIAELPTAKEAQDAERLLIAEHRRNKVPIANNALGRTVSPSLAQHGKAWTSSNKAEVVRMFSEGMDPASIATKINRSTAAVRSVLRKMGMIE